MTSLERSTSLDRIAEALIVAAAVLIIRPALSETPCSPVLRASTAMHRQHVEAASCTLYLAVVCRPCLPASVLHVACRQPRRSWACNLDAAKQAASALLPYSSSPACQCMGVCEISEYVERRSAWKINRNSTDSLIQFLNVCIDFWMHVCE